MMALNQWTSQRLRPAKGPTQPKGRRQGRGVAGPALNPEHAIAAYIAQTRMPLPPGRCAPLRGMGPKAVPPPPPARRDHRCIGAGWSAAAPPPASENSVMSAGSKMPSAGVVAGLMSQQQPHERVSPMHACSC